MESDEKKSYTSIDKETGLNKDVSTIRLFVPGRICLFGEHSDWAGGFRKFDKTIAKGQCIVCGTNQGIYANVQSHPTHLIVTSVNFKDKFECLMDLNTLLSHAQKGGIYSYICGVTYQMLLSHRIGGLVVNNYRCTLPLKKGLSSSAAICVLIARAFSKIYDLKLTIEGEMEYAFTGERTTPSECGRMDQCCAFGARPVLMTFDGDFVNSKELKFGAKSKSLYIVIVDLCSSKDTKVILKSLNRHYHDKSSKMEENEMSKNVKKLFGPLNLEITNKVIACIENGEIEKVGKLMISAQNLFDKYATPACPSQLTSPLLHKVMAYAPIQSHIFGGKGVGSQGDGSCQLLCKSQESQDIVCNTIVKDLNMSCIKLVIGGHAEIHKCVIPTASYGASVFPASKCISTALFPIIDCKDGYLKPAILIIVEQALSCGLNEIYLIVSPHDLPSFQSLFHCALDRSQFGKLPPKLQTYSSRILEIGKHVHLIVQSETEGLGHAVFCAKKYIENDKFVLLLGDHLYRSLSESKGNCIEQLLAFHRTNHTKSPNSVGLKITNESEIGHYGAVCGQKMKTGAFDITEVVEKPSIDYAQKHLRVDGLRGNEYLTIFGLYILDGGRLCELLANNIENQRREKGLFQLTSCLETLRKEQSMAGLVIDGHRFDIGNSPNTYLNALSKFHVTNGNSNSNHKHVKNDENMKKNNVNGIIDNIILNIDHHLSE